MKSCNFCGTQLNDNARICVVCGRKPFAASSAQPTPAQTTTAPAPQQAPAYTAPQPAPVYTAPAPGYSAPAAEINYGQNIGIDYGQSQPQPVVQQTAPTYSQPAQPASSYSPSQTTVDYGQNIALNYGQDIPIDYGQNIGAQQPSQTAQKIYKPSEQSSRIIGKRASVKPSLISSRKTWIFKPAEIDYADKHGFPLFSARYSEIASVQVSKKANPSSIVLLVIGLIVLILGFASELVDFQPIPLIVSAGCIALGIVFLVRNKVVLYTTDGAALEGRYRLKNGRYPLQVFLNDIEIMRAECAANPPPAPKPNPRQSSALKAAVIGKQCRVKPRLFSSRKTWIFGQDALSYMDKNGNALFSVPYSDIRSFSAKIVPNVENIIFLAVGIILCLLGIGYYCEPIPFIIGCALIILGSIFLLKRKITIYTEQGLTVNGKFNLINKSCPINAFLNDLRIMTNKT